MPTNTPPKTHAHRLAEKKAAVLGGKQTRPVTRKALGVFLTLLAVVGVAFWLLRPRSGPEAERSAPASATEVAFPADLFDDGKARFYEFTAADGVTIRYFILKSSDGVIRAAFDACDSCWPAGRGYRQDGDDMVCRNCRRRFPSVKVNEVRGGCNPAPLPRELRNGQVVIRTADILQGRRFFDFGREREG